jgi:threonine dehydrogenase-like Zn-dependent dehydrogenase
MKALRFDGKLQFVRDADLPRREGEALVQVICAGICNTDLEIVKGYAGFRGTPGHEFVGRVVESPEASLVGRRVVGEINAGCGECPRCLTGDPRHCADRTVLGIKGRDGAFAEFLSLPARNLLEVPDSVSDEAAVFVEPLAAAFNVIEQVNIGTSSDVVVVGDGKLAQLIVLVLARTGCTITVIGRHEEKLDLARAYGAHFGQLGGVDLRLESFGRFDIAIEASGSASGLENALKLVKPRGTIVLKSTHHDLTPIDTSQVVVNELNIVGSRCGRFAPALSFLARGDADLTPLISRRVPVEDGVFAFEQAQLRNVMKVILQTSGRPKEA